MIRVPRQASYLHLPALLQRLSLKDFDESQELTGKCLAKALTPKD